MNVFAALLQGNSFLVSPLSEVSLADMNATTGHRSKILHLVRHAQGIHNVVGEKGAEALLSQELFDAQLSPLGWQQVNELRKKVEASGLTKKIDLVVTSPLLRTLQTALGVFGCESPIKGMDMHQSMIANGGNRDSCATSNVNSPPIVAVELCRERLGLNPCDKRRSISEYETLYPAIDFKLVESEDDILWKADVREPFEEVAARGMKFINWLWTRQEKEIAIVSHGIFLQQTLNALLKDSQLSGKKDLCSRFRNCELRSVVIVERSTIGPSHTGNISTGLHLPSDVTKENTSTQIVTHGAEL